MKKACRLGILFVLLSALTLRAQESSGQTAAAREGMVQFVTVPAPALAGNRLMIPEEQVVAVYLPPSYTGGQQRFPVVFYLPGFGDQIPLYTDFQFYQGFQLKEAMDRLIGQGKIREMIVVIANGLTPLGGSFYVNSPMNGDWEKFVSSDLVRHLDGQFRTIASPASRVLTGHSMGGFGALFLAMRHPDVFGGVYSLSPGLAAPGGLRTHPSFADPRVRQRVTPFLERLASMDECTARVALVSQANAWNQVFDFLPLFALAYGSAFAPGQPGSAHLLDYPAEGSGQSANQSSAVWEKYDRGFGDWDAKVSLYAPNLKRLRLLVIDVGEKDEHAWIPAGCRYVSDLLKARGIPHELLVHPGGHQDHMRDRWENEMLPRLSKFFDSGAREQYPGGSPIGHKL